MSEVRSSSTAPGVGFGGPSSGSSNAALRLAQTGGVPQAAPHSIEAEQSVLGAVLLDNESINSILEIIRPEDFHLRAHQYLFEAMVGLNEAGDPIDVVTLAEALRSSGKLEDARGVEYISRILDIVPTAANKEFYARTIKEMSLRRKVIKAATEMTEEAQAPGGDVDSLLDSIEQRVFSISDSRITPSFVRVGEIVKDSIKDVERRYVSKEPLTGVPTGFVEYDSLTSGLQPSDLLIIAGRPSMGKTSLALSIASHIGLHSETNQGVALFSLEMSKEQIVMRLLCGEAGVSSGAARSGKLVDNDFSKLVSAAAKLDEAPIYIDDTPAISVLEMRAKARRLHRERGLGLIMVDYLQLMRGSGRRMERREQEISEISGALKALAKELKIPVIALSQLNRGVEARQDKRPMMSDLRESGAIEQDADLIAFIYRDEVYHPDTQDKGVAEFIVAKHRNGPTGIVRLAFQGEYTRFRNLEETEFDYDYLGDDLTLDDDDDLI